MKISLKSLIIFAACITNFSCSYKLRDGFKPKEIYKSNDLIITQIAEHSYKHTSFKQTNDFGNVPCNGLVVKSNNETIVFDTPTNNKSSEELITWINETLHCKINAVIPTHFHDDCLGGLKSFDEHNIPSYAFSKTIELAKQNNYVVPKNAFNDSLVLKVGNESIVVKYFGEGHTKDNVVGYFPGDNILFGGCLIKELNAGKGYLGDANVKDWPATVERIKVNYPNLKIVVPGHGDYGNTALLDYTIKLFKAQ